jgi:hypothetical protein
LTSRAVWRFRFLRTHGTAHSAFADSADQLTDQVSRTHEARLAIGFPLVIVLRQRKAGQFDCTRDSVTIQCVAVLAAPVQTSYPRYGVSTASLAPRGSCSLSPASSMTALCSSSPTHTPRTYPMSWHKRANTKWSQSEGWTAWRSSLPLRTSCFVKSAAERRAGLKNKPRGHRDANSSGRDGYRKSSVPECLYRRAGPINSYRPPAVKELEAKVRLWHLTDVDADAQHVRFQG